MFNKTTTDSILFFSLSSLKNKAVVDNFLLYSIVLFLLVSATFFIMIMVSRSAKISNEKKAEQFRPELEKILMELLFEEVEINVLLNNPLLKKCLANNFLRSVLLSELLKLRENFAGDHALKLEQFYSESGLKEDSLKRLRKDKWHEKCQAIKELTQMNVRSAYNEIFKYTRHKNQVLRREAQLSVVKLEGFHGLSFIDGYTEYVSEWEQMNFISLLNTLPDEAPDFSKWLSSNNETVKIFALRLIIHFNQATAMPAVALLLESGSNEFVLIAIHALIRFQEVQYLNDLTRLFGKRNNKMDIAILKAISSLGSEQNTPFLLQQATSEVYELRFNAVYALKTIKGAECLELKELSTQSKEIEAIVSHINDTRIYE